MPIKPLLLLDVDGVLCPTGSGPGESMRTVMVDEFPIVFSEKLPARLATLSERFTLVWATSWEDGANQHLAPALGLPELPVISFAGSSARPGRTWKLPAVKQFIRDRPTAWVEDALGRDAHAWAQKRTVPTLLLDINPSWGLAEAHVDILIAFAGRLGAA
jgi:Swiss Army Knife RNA repair-like protein